MLDNWMLSRHTLYTFILISHILGNFSKLGNHYLFKKIGFME